MIKVKAEDITKVFYSKNGNNGTNGCVEALGGINLEIRTGEFLALVGPSGCGKSTFLEILGGLIKPSCGSIYIDGKAVDGPNHDRGIVFQGYALFPWRNVTENIAYGLEEKGVPKKTRNDICKKYISLGNRSAPAIHFLLSACSGHSALFWLEDRFALQYLSVLKSRSIQAL